MIRFAQYRKWAMRQLLLMATFAACTALFAQEKLSADELERFSLLHATASQPVVEGNRSIALVGRSLPPIPSTWTYSSLGLFCKLDVQLERHFPLPVFFRVGGDVQQVELWEGKHDPSH